ncbi:MAG TPA: hypothetical protein VE890_17875, partial [Thermoguttaceae bacterium]|nr:hypothetical protein [Thermoguttaceae bacterium]
DCPRVSPTAFVHPTATVIGRVIIEDGVYVGPQAVLRADEPGEDGLVWPVIVAEQANVQDGAIVHALGGTGVTIGLRSSIAHAAVIHGPCEIGDDCFVGFNSVVFDATLGDGVVVMHHALVEGVDVPDGLHVPSMTAVCDEHEVRRLSPRTPEMIAFAAKVAQTNIRFAKDGLRRAGGTG